MVNRTSEIKWHFKVTRVYLFLWNLFIFSGCFHFLHCCALKSQTKASFKNTLNSDPASKLMRIQDWTEFALIHGPNIPSSYEKCSLQHWTLLPSTSHIHNCMLFLLSLRHFILSVVISPLISHGILGTYRPGEFVFQYPIILPFHIVHWVLKARILKWFAISFSKKVKVA